MINVLSNDGIEFEMKHMANSAAIIDLPEAYYRCSKTRNNALWILSI